MYKLRDYQKEAVDKTIAYFQKTRAPAVLVLPTGAGKSVVIAELARIARGRVLVLAHVKELVDQNLQKYQSYGLEGGVFSAGLDRKESKQKVIFGSIQSVGNAPDEFFEDFSLIIIDECHRVDTSAETQYAQVVKKLTENNPELCILGLTATPYRMNTGWIYNRHLDGVERTTEARFFKNCIYELPLKYLIEQSYLSPPLRLDTPVTSYDFSELTEKRLYTQTEVEELLKKQKSLTPLILKNIVEIVEQFDRKGVMIFAASVEHARDIMICLESESSALVLGSTPANEREQIINNFKERKIKFLVNVSVLTTGFDASHVDLVAILRPTESVSLYQQIIGRGLRLHDGKKECIVLDYSGMGHNIFSPEISDKRPGKNTVPVEVSCPSCGHLNHFWGWVDSEGDVVEHTGQKCRGMQIDPRTLQGRACGYLFRYKLCPECQTQNELSAEKCTHCKSGLTDAATKLKQARLSKDTHLFKPDSLQLEMKASKNGTPYLEVAYYDFDGQKLSEFHFLNSASDFKKLQINFLRFHLKRPEEWQEWKNPDVLLSQQSNLRLPFYLIARKNKKFWQITEKIFAEELPTKKHSEL